MLRSPDHKRPALLLLQQLYHDRKPGPTADDPPLCSARTIKKSNDSRRGTRKTKKTRRNKEEQTERQLGGRGWLSPETSLQCARRAPLFLRGTTVVPRPACSSAVHFVLSFSVACRASSSDQFCRLLVFEPESWCCWRTWVSVFGACRRGPCWSRGWEFRASSVGVAWPAAAVRKFCSQRGQRWCCTCAVLCVLCAQYGKAKNKIRGSIPPSFQCDSPAILANRASLMYK